MATEFAISRFFVPRLAQRGAALFADCDMLARCDLVEVFEVAESAFENGAAVACVRHGNYLPAEVIKMDGQLQTYYERKNWSSFMIFNCDHPLNKLALDSIVNVVPGRDLHAFCWLEDSQVAPLPATYNHLVGDQPHDPQAKIIHWTNGGPWFPKYTNAPFAPEWRDEWRMAAA